MAELNIPTEVKDKSAFPQVDKTARQIIAYAVLMRTDNQVAFMRFHPEFIDASGKAMNSAGKQASRQFWSWGKVKDYREQYETELAEFLGRKQTSQSSEFDELSEEDKAEAVKMFRGKVYRAMRTVDETNIAALTDVGGLAKSTKVLNENEEQEIRPLRFLPEKCFSSCRYRLFVENAVKGGDLINDCDYCRALRFARENGFKGDDTNMLDLPKEVLDAEPENTVSTLDILAGKIDN